MLVACSTKELLPPIDPSSVPDNKALVQVARESLFFGAGNKFHIYKNGEYVGNLKSGANFSWEENPTDSLAITAINSSSVWENKSVAKTVVIEPLSAKKIYQVIWDFPRHDAGLSPILRDQTLVKEQQKKTHMYFYPILDQRADKSMYIGRLKNHISEAISGAGYIKKIEVPIVSGTEFDIDLRAGISNKNIDSLISAASFYAKSYAKARYIYVLLIDNRKAVGPNYHTGMYAAVIDLEKRRVAWENNELENIHGLFTSLECMRIERENKERRRTGARLNPRWCANAMYSNIMSKFPVFLTDGRIFEIPLVKKGDQGVSEEKRLYLKN